MHIVAFVDAWARFATCFWKKICFLAQIENVVSISLYKNRRDMLSRHQCKRACPNKNKNAKRREVKAYRHIPTALGDERSDGCC